MPIEPSIKGLISAISKRLPLSGGVMTGFLTLNADPVNDLHAVTKQYADALIGGGPSGPFVRTSIADTITAVHTFNPAAPGAPFILGVNAQGQLVTGLNADLLDGQSGAFYLARANHTGTQAPATISPQGAGSGLDSDLLDGLSSAAFALAVHTHAPADITPQGAGSGLDADLLDGQHGAFYLARANHTGTQAPATISPQGSGSGLDADLLDGLNSTAFQPIDAGLTALASLGAGIAVSDGADGWFARSLAVTDSATVDFTLTNASGVAGNPTITASVLPGGIDHNALLNLAVGDVHTHYLLLAGRAGTANDAVLTTSATGVGSFAGGTAVDAILRLRSSTSGSAHTGYIGTDDTLRLRPDVVGTSIAASFSAIIAYPGVFGGVLTIGADGVSTSALQTLGTIEFVTGTPGGQNVISNGWAFLIDTLGARFPGVTLFANNPIFNVDTVAISDAGSTPTAVMRSAPTFITTNGGTFTTHEDYLIHEALILNGAITNFSKYGYRIVPPTLLNGAALDNFYGIYIDDFPTGVDNYAYVSVGSSHQFVHGGYMRVGNAALAAAPAGINLDVFTGDIQIRDGNDLRWREPTVSGTDYVSFRAPSCATQTYDLPAAFPSVDGQALVSTMAGVMSWATAGGVTDHGALTGLVPDDDHTQYLLLAGRALTANDYALTTSVGGTGIGAGGTDVGAIYRLRASSSASAHTGNINLDDATQLMGTAFTVTAANFNLLNIAPGGITQNIASTLRLFNFAPTVTLDSDITSFQLFRCSPIFTPPAGESHTLGAGTFLNFAPTYTPVAGQALTGLSFRALFLNDTYTNAGAGNTVTLRYGLDSTGTLGTNWTATDWAAVRMSDPGGAGVITNLYGVDIGALTSHTSTVVAAFNSAVAAAAGKFFLRDTGGAQSSLAGKFTTYNNVATQGQGLPSIVRLLDSTAVAAARVAAALWTPAAAGWYRVSFVITLTRAATTSSILGAGVNINYTTGDGAAAVSQNVPMYTQGATTATVDVGSAANVVGTTLFGSVLIYSSTTGVTYDVGYTSLGGTTMQYAERIRVEAL